MLRCGNIWGYSTRLLDIPVVYFARTFHFWNLIEHYKSISGREMDTLQSRHQWEYSGIFGAKDTQGVGVLGLHLGEVWYCASLEGANRILDDCREQALGKRIGVWMISEFFGEVGAFPRGREQFRSDRALQRDFSFRGIRE